MKKFISLHFIKLVLCLSVALLIGCAKRPELPPEESWQIHKTAVEKLTQFQTSGSFSYVSNTTKHYARFHWSQKNPSEYTLLITTPLGGKVVEIISTPTYAKVIDNKNNEYVEDNTETLLANLLHISLPLSQLQQLLIGLANDDKQTQITLNSQGLLERVNFDHQGKKWKITFKHYALQTKHRLMLPERIDLQQDDIKVTLKMTDWKY